MRKNGPLHYLASPYTGSQEAQQYRYEQVREAAATLFRQEIWIFSPIIHCHDISTSHGLPGSFDYWDAYDRTMLYHCDDMWILPLPGWEKSRGIKAERKICADYNKPVYLVQAISPSVQLMRLSDVLPTL